MTEEELKAIEADLGCSDWGCSGEHVPALIAEVRRLRAVEAAAVEVLRVRHRDYDFETGGREESLRDLAKAIGKETT